MITVYGYIGAPSPELREAVTGASLVVGGRRHLDALNVPDDHRIVLGRIGPAIDALKQLPAEANAVVIASGDPLFYGVVRRIRAAGLKVRVVPTVTSLQLAFAAGVAGFQRIVYAVLTAAIATAPIWIPLGIILAIRRRRRARAAATAPADLTQAEPTPADAPAQPSE